MGKTAGSCDEVQTSVWTGADGFWEVCLGWCVQRLPRTDKGSECLSVFAGFKARGRPSVCLCSAVRRAAFRKSSEAVCVLQYRSAASR